MNPDYIQNLRYKLQKRMRRVNAADIGAFVLELKFFLQFLHGNSIMMGIIEQLVVGFPAMKDTIEENFERDRGTIGESEVEHAVIGYNLAVRWSVDENGKTWSVDGLRNGYRGDRSEILDALRRVFIEPLYEYIDEQLDDSRAILAHLVRYKHRCEWFRQGQLRGLVSSNTQSGEKSLALDLYEYLHDQGMYFHIEPHSASGIPDLIADQRSDDPLVADAKIFDPSNSKGKSYLIKGFNQVYTYTRDFNESFGYLVIYRFGAADLKFDVSGMNMSVPYVTYNGKTIFLVVIDIHDYGTSASKRGQLECVEITEEMLIKVIEDGSNDVAADIQSDQSPVIISTE